MHLRLALALTALLLSTPARAMDLGTNFWNIGWHKPGDCFQDYRSVAGDNPWNPQFLNEIKIYHSLRFMDWDNTNGSTRQRWQERNPQSTPKQNPVAYEWMIDLCNRNQSDMWVTIPHRTITHATGDQPSDYALRLCILVKTGVDTQEINLPPLLHKLQHMTPDQLVAAGGVKTCRPLDPTLKLYVEYSNETWNGAFKQSHYCCDEGTALELDPNQWTAGFRFHAWAAIRLFHAADLVFGPDSPRLVKVLATQSANSWIIGQHLEVMTSPQWNPWNVKANAIATAPYFGHNVQGDDPNAETLLKDAIGKSAEESARHHEIAEKAGLRLIAYEGGQHVYRKAKPVNQSPLIFTLYQEYLQAMAPFFDHFSHYCHVGQAGDGGAWGCIEYTGQPIDQAHKYRALVQWSQSNPKQ